MGLSPLLAAALFLPSLGFADSLPEAWRQAKKAPIARPAAPDPVSLLDRAFAPLVDAAQPPHKRYVGIWVGVIAPGVEKSKGYGLVSLESELIPGESTIFEIGSLTKAFTGILLARAIQEDKARLDDPISSFLPPQVKAPAFQGKAIRLEHLATHSAGFPKLPADFKPRDFWDPYRDYTADRLYAFLSTHTLVREPGGLYEYSNLGMGLLGHALGLKHNRDYAALVQEKIAGPLGLADTVVSLSRGQQARAAQGHHWEGVPAKPWTWPPDAVLAGAGSLKSTGKDMMEFLKANLGIKPNPLASALELSHAPLHSRSPGESVGMGWHISGELVWHNGGTFGCRSYMGFDKERGVGIVVLSNSILLNEAKDDLEPRLDQAALEVLRGLVN